MDAKDILSSDGKYLGSKIEVTGWLVDQPEGLYIFGDHYPPDYDFPYKVLVNNRNMMRAILLKVTTLGGGRSNLFYRCKAVGKYDSLPPSLHVENLFIEEMRGSGLMEEIDISEELIQEQVTKKGEYVFSAPRALSQDWLDDL